MCARLVVILLLFEVARCVQAQTSNPAVSQASQMERDLDRRFVLGTELQAERAEMVKALSAFNASRSAENEDKVQRHLENVQALQRELAGTSRRGTQGNVRMLAKAIRPSISAPTNKFPRFWDPYNRAPDTTAFSVNP